MKAKIIEKYKEANFKIDGIEEDYGTIVIKSMG